MVTSGPLKGSHFTLDTSGVAGVFGGEEAVSAMATVHVYENRRWLGWYNAPGSYHIAKRYGLLAKSRFFDGFFPGVHTDAASLFDLDGWKGPKFRGAHSGTIMEETGHLAALFMKIAASLEGKVIKGSLFGQIMFVSSLGVSWGYNSWLSSLDKEKIQKEILLNHVLGEPKVTKYYFGTRTSMVVFVLLVLQPEDPGKILNDLLPNDTKVWRKLKLTIVERLVNKEKLHFEVADADIHGFTDDEKILLTTLYGDVHSAYEGYQVMLGDL
ncbi:hypothetical protein BDN67DRAFT_971637 [Paxillus ammoniavirescens]|nr:hypothetical protein BDN67DRAFT_971637 [Paxillus ammoniavirescens]